jgi:hypothetical protein
MVLAIIALSISWHCSAAKAGLTVHKCLRAGMKACSGAHPTN